MKIVHVAQTLGRGGVEVLLERIIHGQRERGHKVRVVTLTSGGDVAERLKKSRVPVVISGVTRSIPTELYRLRLELLRGSPDVVHMHALPAGTLGRLALLGITTKQVRKVYHIHTILSRAHSPGRLMILRERLLAEACDEIIAISHAVKEDTVKTFNIPEEKVKVLYSGVPDIPERLKVTKKCARELFAIPEKQIVVSCVANLLPHKGHKMLLEAFSKVQGAVLYLAGEGSERATIELAIEQLDLKDRVHLLGSITTVEELFSASDIVVQPSTEREGLGLAMIEAARAGLPGIVTDVDGLPEVVENGMTGIVVPSDDIDGFAGGVQLLIDDEYERTTMGKAARLQYEQLFQFDRFLDELEWSYRE
ncbi:glycosyltransferase family 4 protein [bacterium]|nr:glycosyltransferase family 4 protein [bacterium]